MMRRTAPIITLAVLFAASPALAENVLLLADGSGSKSRAEARHDINGTTASKSTSARSKTRRATRGSASSSGTEVATKNRGKRSRRNPGKDAISSPMLAETDTNSTGLLALAANTENLKKHVQSTEFTTESGALALYQLIGKALADMPLDATEMRALKVALDGADYAWLIAHTEARLTEASADGETLDQIAEALGVPRPIATPGMNPNLGASLTIETDVSPG